MKTLAGLLLATLLTITAGCAQKDWIDRTLVTVDVTGSWSGSVGGSAMNNPGEILLDLEQEGATVKGFVRFRGHVAAVLGASSREPVTGTVSGDVFRFRDARGRVEGQLTVSGDDMNGIVSMAGQRPVILRRAQ